MENILTRSGHYFLRYYLLLLLLFAGYSALELQPRFYRSVLWSDSEGYYLYLPALFINGGFEDLRVRTEEQFPMYGDTNKRFTKYTCGLAMMELPFFLGAHALTLTTGGEADGYSHYYVRALQLAALVYGFLGLLLLKRLLEKHFSRGVTFLTIVGLFLGTNLYHYVIQGPSMSHVYSFFLFACFVWLTPKFYERPGWKRFAIMGGLLGLIVLIRPTNILILLYLLLYNIRSGQEAKERLSFVGRHFKSLLVTPLASLLFFVPQFLYWKYISGDWLIYSYGEEGFNWLNPRIDMVLFHVKNGWLYYSPMAGLCILGCLFGCWKNRYNIAPIFLIWVLLLYITSSWWNWWFGGAFGHRNFVEYYLLLAFPYAWLFTQVLESRWTPPKIMLLALWVFLIYYGYMLAVYYPGGLYERWSLKIAWQHMWEFDFSTHYEK